MLFGYYLNNTTTIINRKELGKDFRIDKNVLIYISENEPELKFTANQIASKLKDVFNIDVSIQQSNDALWKQHAIILFREDNLNLGKEGYLLDVNDKQLTIKGTPQGIFYGAQTLFQLFPLKREVFKKQLKISCVKIIDKPRFEWRGFMLDVGRYFQPVSVVKRYIDFLAMYKINTFHWHLTDDQGWRIEIKNIPN